MLPVTTTNSTNFASTAGSEDGILLCLEIDEAEWIGEGEVTYLARESKLVHKN